MILGFLKFKASARKFRCKIQTYINLKFQPFSICMSFKVPAAIRNYKVQFNANQISYALSE